MSTKTSTISAERAKSLLKYDPETGILTWKAPECKPSKAGKEASAINKASGYARVFIDGIHLFAHRVAWMVYHGKPPSGVIDHINGIRHDNRLCNLRDATLSMNRQNLRNESTRSTSGFLGVSFRKSLNLFEAKIGYEGKSITIGYFKSPEDAHDAYVQRKRQLHQGCTL